MIFTDPTFLFLALPVTFALFYGVRARFGKTAALGVLFLSSLAIYAPWGLHNLVLLVVSILINFSVATYLLLIETKHSPTRRAVYAAGQCYNLLSLAWFKYTFVQSLYSHFTGRAFDADIIAIPIGISFYTFQQASVLADAYNNDESVKIFVGKLNTLKAKVAGFLRYGFFISFFPHMVIGPIAYLREIQPQVSAPGFGRFRSTNISVGLMLVGIGMFKKLVLADNLGVNADPVFVQAAAGGALNPLSAWLGVFSYYAQLYFDFSGYSDMALGLARMFGVRFPINFNSPLKSVGIVDFYRRWHMTLTRVISRFLFSPLSLAGTRFSAARQLGTLQSRALGLWGPLLLNFEVIALWHGASLPFALFGLVHGSWYVLETEVRRSRLWKAWRERSPDGLRRVLGRALFVLPMALTFAIFRSKSLAATGDLFSQLVTGSLAADRSMPTRRAVEMLGIAFSIIYFLPSSVELLRRYRPGIMTYESTAYGPDIVWRPNWLWAAFWTFLILTSLYFVSRQQPFLYMGF